MTHTACRVFPKKSPSARLFGIASPFDRSISLYLSPATEVSNSVTSGWSAQRQLSFSNRH